MVECPENPSCREDLIHDIDETDRKLRCAVNKKLGIKTAWAGITATLTIIGIGAMITYNAYAGRMERMEASQTKQDVKVEQQAKAMNRIDKTVEKIKTRQGIMIENLHDMKGMLETLINKQINGGHRNGPAN